MHPPLVLVAALSVASAAVPPATHIGMSVSAALGPSAVAEALPLVAPNCLAHDDHAQPTCQEASAGAVDDTPQTRVDLPFAPPVFGRERRSVFVNPNGGLLFGQAPPCGSFFCAINGTWYDSVLPFVADLNPGNTAEGTVVYATAGAADPGGARFEVAWLNVQMFGSDTFEYSFGAALYPSGRIVFAYDAVRDPRHNTTETYGLYHAYLVGLRLPENATAAAATQLSPAQRASRRPWNVGGDGVYPPPGAVADGAVIDFCPLPVSYCLDDEHATVALGGDVDLRTPWFGCGAGGAGDGPGTVRAVCVFRSPSAPHEAPPFTSLLAVAEAAGAGAGALVRCPAPVDAGAYQLTVSYADPASPDAAPAALHETPFSVTVAADPQAAAAPAETCAARDADEASASALASKACDACAACSDTADEPPACLGCNGNVFEASDCSGACGGAALAGAVDGSCCDPALADCLGVCGGTSAPAVNPNSGHTLCCPEYHTIDCLGLCGGGAEVDLCDVCAGGLSGNVPNADVDCDGKCFGTNWDCPAPTPSPSPCPDGDGDGNGDGDPCGDGADGIANDMLPVPPPRPVVEDMLANPFLVTVIVLEVAVALLCCVWCTAHRVLHPAPVGGLPGVPRLVTPGHAQRMRRQRALYQQCVASMPVVEYTGTPPPGVISDVAAGSGEQAACPICLVEVEKGESVKILACRHWYHAECLDSWLGRRNACPMCKQAVITGVSPAENAADRELRRDVLQDAAAVRRAGSGGGAAAAAAAPSWLVAAGRGLLRRQFAPAPGAAAGDAGRRQGVGQAHEVELVAPMGPMGGGSAVPAVASAPPSPTGAVAPMPLQ